MQRKGHVGVATAAYTPLGVITYAAGFDQVAFGGAVAAVGLAMAPDVDILVPGMAHRGPTHTVWFAAAVGVVALLIGTLIGAHHGILAAVGLGLFAGAVGVVTILSHLVADAITPMGIRPFLPRDDREVCLAVCRAANPVANYVLLILGGGVAVVGLVLADALVG